MAKRVSTGPTYAAAEAAMAADAAGGSAAGGSAAALGGGFRMRSSQRPAAPAPAAERAGNPHLRGEMPREEDFQQLEYEEQQAGQAVERRIVAFSGREKEATLLRNNLHKLGAANPVIVSGAVGSGKTSVAALLVKELRAEAGGASTSGRDDFVLWHSFSDSIYSKDVRRALEKFCVQMKVKFNIYMDLPEDMTGVPGAFAQFLTHACLFSRVTVVFDSIDEAEMNGIGHEWLPVSLPLGCRVVFTGMRCQWLNGLKQRSRTWLEIALPPLAVNEQRETIKRIMTSYPGGELMGLDPAEIHFDEAGSTPLYIDLACENLRQLQEEVNDIKYVQESAEDLPPSVRGLINSMLERLEKAHGRTIVSEICSLLHSSKFGLAQDELLKLLQQNEGFEAIQTPTLQNALNPLRAYMWQAQHVPGAPTDNTMRFYVKAIQDVIETRYLINKTEKKKVHKRIAAYLNTKKSTGMTCRCLQERLHQLLRSEDWAALYDYLTAPNVFLYLFDHTDMYHLLELWNGLTTGSRSAAYGVKAVVAEFQKNLKDMHKITGSILDYIHAFVTFLHWTGRHSDLEMIVSDYISGITEEEEHHLAEDSKYLEVISYLGNALAKVKKYEKAIVILDRCKSINLDIQGDDNPSTATILEKITDCKMQLGDFAGVEDALDEQLHILEAAEEAGLISDASKIVETMNKLAEVFEEQNRLKEAESTYESALDRLEQMLGPDHPEVALQMKLMANSYKAHGEWQKSEFCFCRAMSFDHKFFGNTTIHLALAYNYLAELNRSKGDLLHAQALYQKAAQLTEKLLGTEHPDVATYLNNIAELCRVQKKYATAEPLYLKAIAIDEKVLGSKHPTVAIRLNNLAELYRDQGRLKKAIPLYNEAIAIDETALGRTHPNVATYLNNLAGVYKALGEWDRAEEKYKRAMEIDSKALNENHPDISIYLNNLAGLYKAQGRYEEAEPLYLKALEINEAALGEDHTDIAIYSNNIGLLYKEMGRLEDALAFYKKAIDIGERSLGADNLQVGRRLSNMAALMFELEKWEESLHLFARAKDICEKHLGADAKETNTCRRWMEACDVRIEDAAEAARIEEEERAAAGALAEEAADPSPAVSFDNEPQRVADTTPTFAAEAALATPEPVQKTPQTLEEYADRSVERMFSAAIKEAVEQEARSFAGRGNPEAGAVAKRLDMEEEEEMTEDDLINRSFENIFAAALREATESETGSPPPRPESEDAESERREPPPRSGLGDDKDALAASLAAFNAQMAAQATRDAGPPAEAEGGKEQEEEPETAPPERGSEARDPPRAPDPVSDGPAAKEVGPGRGASRRRRASVEALKERRRGYHEEVEAEMRKVDAKEPEPEPATIPVDPELEARLMSSVELVGTRRYKCKECGKIMSTFNLIRMHFTKVHGVKKEEASPGANGIPDAAPAPVPAPAEEPATPQVDISKPEVAAAPASAALDKVKELEEKLANMQKLIEQQNSSVMASSALQVMEAGLRSLSSPQGYQTNIFSPKVVEQQYSSGSHYSGGGVRETSPNLLGVPNKGDDFNHMDEFSSMLKEARGIRPSPKFMKSSLTVQVPAYTSPNFAEKSPAQVAQQQVSSFLGSQGDQVDVIGLFMAARSEQISKRKFVCELDGQEFTTLNIMRVHFERKYAREAQAWWIQQSAHAR